MIPEMAIPAGQGRVQIGSLFFPTAPQGYVGDFTRSTRQSLIPVGTLTPPNPGTAGQQSRQVLPSSGFLGGLWIKLSGTTTTTSAQTTTVATNQYPIPPFPFLRRIRVFSNQNVEILNLTGYELHEYNKTLRTGFSSANPFGDRLTPTALDPAARYFDSPASIGASATDTWAGSEPIWTSWGWSMQSGMILLQDPAIVYTLELTWGDTTDLYSSTSGTPALTNVQVQVMAELYSVPQFADDFPSMSFTKTVTSEIQPLTAGTGDNTFRFVTSNQLSRLMHEIVNNGLPVDMSAITALKMQYASTQVPYVITPDLQLLRQRMLYGQDLHNGWLCHELSNSFGLPELVSNRDIVNTAQLTDLQSILTLAGITLTGAQFLRTIKEQLIANR